MKLGIVADLHFKGEGLERKGKLWDRAVKHMKSMGCSWVLNAGDTFDIGGIGDAKASTAHIVETFLKPLHRHVMPMLVIEGNHDIAGRSASALDALTHDRLVKIAKKDRTWNYVLQSRTESVEVLTLPWIDAIRMDVTECGPLEFPGQRIEDRPTILLGHAELTGSWGDSYASILTGSTKSFDPKDLDGLPIHAAFFGHYHARQTILPGSETYYVGALCRLTHGEAQNPDGFAVFDTQKMSTEFYSVDGPKFYTFPAKELVQKTEIVAGDYVRVEVENSAERWHTVPGVVYSKRYTSDAVTPSRNKLLSVALDSNLPELVEAWADSVNKPLPDAKTLSNALARLRDIRAKEQTPVFPDKILEVELHNVGPHAHLLQTFSNGWSIISGDNGRGKSFVLEAILAAIWGKWLHDRPLLDSVPSNGASTALIRVAFECRGEKWQITRKFKKGSSESVLVHRNNEYAAGSVDSCRNGSQYLLEHFGETWDHGLGTWFLGQDHDEDVTTYRDADRMRWIRTWLGLQIYDSYTAFARETAAKYFGASSRLQHGITTKQAAETRLAELCEAKKETAECCLREKKHLDEIDAIMLKLETDLRKSFLALGEKRGLQREIVQLNASILAGRESCRSASEMLEGYREKLKTLDYSLEEILDLSEREERSNYLQRELQHLLPAVKKLEDAGCAKIGFMPCPLIDHAMQNRTRFEECNQELQGLYTGAHAKRAEELRQIRYQESVILGKIEECNTILRNYAVNDLEAKAEKLREDLGNIKIDERYTVEQEELVKNTSALRKEVSDNYHTLMRRCAVEESAIQRLEQDLAELESEIAATREDVKIQETYSFLAEACGKNGIPQYLINNRLPDIQSRLDDICQNTLEGAYRVKLSTSKEGRKKEIESFSIVLNDRDVRSASGGERALARMILRCALLQDCGQHRGLLLADEPCAAMSPAKIQAMIDILARMSDRFNQIIMSSHSPMFAAFSAHHIEL